MTTAHQTRSVPLTGTALVRFLKLERDYLNETDRLAICARCKEARIRSGLEQTELGELLQPPVGDRTIYNYETTRPPFKYLRQWAEITGASYDWLLRGVEETPVTPEQTDHLAQEIAEALTLLREIAERLRGEPPASAGGRP